jgi:ParB-like chromosome segregation protein Spo0J
MLKRVKVADLTVSFFVRKSLSDDRILQFGLLYEAKATDIPPIEVNERLEVIDGRHRLEGLKMAGILETDVEIKSGLSRAEEILEGLKANMGGAMPPTAADIRLAIQAMLTAGLSARDVQKGLPLPPSIAKRYVSDAQSAMAKQRMASALDAVADGEVKPAEAAEKYGVDVESLRAAVRGRRKTAATDSLGFPAIKAALSTQYRSQSQKNASMFQRLIDGYADGDCTYSMVNNVFDHAEKMMQQAASRIPDWRKRLDAAKAIQVGK